jgi:hypothetical protein
MSIYEIRFTDGTTATATINRKNYPAGSGMLMTFHALEKMGVTAKNYKKVRALYHRYPEYTNINCKYVNWEQIYLNYLKEKA